MDILLICALKDEYAQVLNVTDGLMSPGWQERSEAGGWIVADGRFSTSSNIPLTIRAAYASYMGREQVQALAGRLIEAERPRCIAMSGVCAGRRGKVGLGDVIFAERLWSYDAGKTTVEDGKTKFQGDMLSYRPSPVWVQRTQSYRPSPVWVQRMQSMSVANSPWLQERPALPLEYQEDWVLLRLLAGEEPSQHPDFQRDCPDWSAVLARLWQRQWLERSSLGLTSTGRERAQELKLLYHGRLPKPQAFQIHVAPMASGAAVVVDEGIFPRLADSMRKVLAIDMEASALGALGDIHNIPVLVAKGVQDFGDSFKDDRYRSFAARASAECLIALLRQNADLLPERKESVAENLNSAPKASTTEIPRDLIELLAEEFPDVRDARALWQRAGGKASEVENISRPFDLWQRLWLRSIQGAAARPEALLREALQSLPDNAVIRRYLAAWQAN